MAERCGRGLPPHGGAHGLTADARARPVHAPPDDAARDPAGDALGLTDAGVRDLVERLDALLARVERATGPVAELAAETVRALALLYGTALARVTALAAAAPDVRAALAGDELLHHLLALHGVHPWPAAERIRRVLDDLRPQSHGERVELAGVEDGVARLRRSEDGCGGGCGRSARAVERAIGQAVLAAAPELRGVEFMPVRAGRPSSALIPAESLLRRPPAATPSEPAARSRGGAP